MYWALLVGKLARENRPFPETLNLSKNEIARLYHLPPETTPHRAMNGVEHLLLCYKTTLGCYPHLNQPQSNLNLPERDC